MTPQEIIQTFQDTAMRMDTSPSDFSNHDLNAPATYGHGIGKRARTILRGRNVKMPNRQPLEW